MSDDNEFWALFFLALLALVVLLFGGIHCEVRSTPNGGRVEK